MNYSDYIQQELFGVPNWKILFLLFSVVGLYLFRGAVLWICAKIKKAQNHFDEKTFMQFFFDQQIEKAISWIIIVTGAYVILEYLQLPAAFSKYLLIMVKLVLTFNIIRICYMAAEAFGLSMQEWAKKTETEFDDQLAPFASRTLKVMVVIVGVLIGLQNFGVNVTALLAGLGIGGVALAFAAQDTVANVFGTITIILDRPFKLGDAIKIGETEGTIEEVGFRSTRIRTPYNSVVSLPNSVVAKEKIDNLSQRNGWIRFRHVLGFTYDAKVEIINTFCENLKYQLLQDPTIDRERINVFFNAFADSSLNVLVIFHYNLQPDENDLKKVSGYLELIYKTAEENKLSFAFPTRTMIINNVEKGKSL